MGRIKTFVDGGVILPSDLNSMQDDYENGFAGYRRLHTVWGNALGNAAIAGPSPLANGTMSLNGTGYGLLLDPARYSTDSAEWSVNPRTVKYSVAAVCAVLNNTAPGITFTVGLYPAGPNPDSGSSGTFGVVLSGSVISGSTVTFASPSNNSVSAITYSGDFTAPTNGVYVLGCVLSGTQASAANTTIIASLDVRQI